MSEHPFHDLALEARKYFLDNPADPQSVELIPLSLHMACRAIVTSRVTSPALAVWLLGDAAGLNAPLKLEVDRIELEGTLLFPAFIEILTHSISGYIFHLYEDVRREVADRPAL